MAFAVREWAHGSRAARLWRALQSRAVLGVGYGVAALLTGVAILLAASPPTQGPLRPASDLILTVLGFNLILILGLILAVALGYVALWEARDRDPGARLQLRFVNLFALAAMAPAVVVALFYGVLVNRGVDNWFSQRVKTVVEDSATLARSYVDEQRQYIHDHLIPMGQDLNRTAPGLAASPISFSHYLARLANFHGFSAGYLIDRDGRILARAEASDAPPFVMPPPASFQTADQGNIIWVCNANCGDVMRAVYRLQNYSDAYLYIIRPVEKGIVSHLFESEASLVAYREAANNRTRIQTIFALSYVETALLVLVGAVWLGMGAANALSGPIARLVQAAGRVAGGDLSARVDADSDPEEIAVLSRAFNGMTHDLQAQQEALRTAHEDAERRREFIETVLAEVSAGVVGVDAKGRITAANRQATALLGLRGQSRGKRLAEAAPEVAAVLEQAGRGAEAETEIDVVRGRETHRLRVRASRIEGGLVLTFDDITRLVNAQRNAAWRDVARRIAHEIKNPLTPIQLSAERLRKKYRKDIAPAELETFDRCNDTIVRQVDTIRQMVDEFSSFARMPAPKFVEQDAAELLRAAVFAQRVAAPDVDVALEEPTPAAHVMADEHMMAQALTNVLKNATEAIATRRSGGSRAKGRIRARLVSDENGVTFEVEDNGVGLPDKDRDRLTEPYVTTREKGTGLGLAIVKRILEDHGGELELTDARSGAGALAILRLPPSARVKPASKSQPVTA